MLDFRETEHIIYLTKAHISKKLQITDITILQNEVNITVNIQYLYEYPHSQFLFIIPL